MNEKQAIHIRPILPTPAELVTGGRFNLGTYDGVIPSVNPLDAEIGGLFGVSPFLRNLRLKEWQHFALVNRSYYISLAIFNAKVLGLVQVCIQDREQGRIYFYERKALPWRIKLPMNLSDDKASFVTPGFSLSIRNLLCKNEHHIEFDVHAEGDKPAVRGSFICHEGPQPINVCLPLHEGRAMYSHKYICPIQGKMFIGEKEVSFDPDSSYGLSDIHKGYYPWEMTWHWATGGGYEGKTLTGFNFTDNQVKDQDSYNENCVWIDGMISLMPPVKFDFNVKDLYQPWRISDRFGMVNLTFTPIVIRTVDINALVIKSRYRGPFGEFNGEIRLDDGRTVRVDGFTGMCEDFYLRT